LDKQQIVLTPDPVAAAKCSIEWARQGDVLLLQTLGGRDKVIEVLEAASKDI
jgi:hypothetical protein